jgi:cytochrome c-type biogenesis protein CcmH/NrfG
MLAQPDPRAALVVGPSAEPNLMLLAIAAEEQTKTIAAIETWARKLICLSFENEILDVLERSARLLSNLPTIPTSAT